MHLLIILLREIERGRVIIFLRGLVGKISTRKSETVAREQQFGQFVHSILFNNQYLINNNQYKLSSQTTKSEWKIKLDVSNQHLGCIDFLGKLFINFQWLIQFLKRRSTMSGHRIFNSQIKGEIQGRNANIGGTMFKRAPIFTHVSSERQQTTPFANYNCRTNESVLSESYHFSYKDRQSSTQSIQSLRKIAKEQLDKHHFAEEINKKHIQTLQAQVNDLKEKFVQYEKSSLQRNDEKLSNFKQSISLEIERAGKQVQVEISTKLRSYFQKAHLELRKQIMVSVSNEFITKTFLDDLQIRLEQINDRFDLIDGKIKNKYFSIDELHKNTTPSIIVENLQVKLAKIERQIELNKKYFVQTSSRIKHLEDLSYEDRHKKENKDLEEVVNSYKEKLKQIELDNVNLWKKIGNADTKGSRFQADLNFIKSKVLQLEKNHDEHILIIKDLSQRFSSSEQPKSDIKDYLKSNQNLSNSLIINNSENMAEVLKSSEQTSIFHDHSSVMDVNIENNSNPFMTFQKKEQKNEAAENKSLYQIDKQGYLMDGDGKYLLTGSGSMVRLTNQQIKALSQSELIELC